MKTIRSLAIALIIIIIGNVFAGMVIANVDENQSTDNNYDKNTEKEESEPINPIVFEASYRQKLRDLGALDDSPRKPKPDVRFGRNLYRVHKYYPESLELREHTNPYDEFLQGSWADNIDRPGHGFTAISPAKIDISRYTSHAPIYIDGNSEFASQAASEGWAGDGTEANPYIIEDYDIDASQAIGDWWRAGIKKNTTVRSQGSLSETAKIFLFQTAA